MNSKLIAGLSAGILLVGAPLTVLTVQSPSMAQEAGQATFGNLIAALNNVNVQIRNLEALNDLTVEDVRVVDVDDVLNGNNIEALNNSLNRNNVDVDVLRNALNNNEVIKNSLNNVNVAVNDVVAIDVLSGGDVVVFYQE